MNVWRIWLNIICLLANSAKNKKYYMRKFRSITSDDNANVYVGPESELVIGDDHLL